MAATFSRVSIASTQTLTVGSYIASPGILNFGISDATHAGQLIVAGRLAVVLNTPLPA